MVFLSGAQNKHKRGRQPFTGMVPHPVWIIMTFLIGAIFVSTGGASEWVSYGVDATGIMQFDRDSISWSSQDTVKVWTRLVHSDEGKKGYILNLQTDRLSKYNELQNTDTLVEINCRIKKAKFLLIEDYDTKGSPLYSGNLSSNLRSKWYNIVPGSVADELRGIVCIPSSVAKAGQGIKETTAPEPSGSSSSETKRETWTRIYDYPGQQEADYQRALQEEKREQQKQAEERSVYEKRRLREKESGDGEVELEVGEKEAKRLIFGPPPMVIVPESP
jgi:hypothetical protein